MWQRGSRRERDGGVHDVSFLCVPLTPLSKRATLPAQLQDGVQIQITVHDTQEGRQRNHKLVFPSHRIPQAMVHKKPWAVDAGLGEHTLVSFVSQRASFCTTRCVERDKRL